MNVGTLYTAVLADLCSVDAAKVTTSTGSYGVNPGTFSFQFTRVEKRGPAFVPL